MQENRARIELSEFHVPCPLSPPKSFSLFSHAHTYVAQSLGVGYHNEFFFIFFFKSLCLICHSWIFRIPSNVSSGERAREDNFHSKMFLSRLIINIYFSAPFFSHCFSARQGRRALHTCLCYLHKRFFLGSSLENPRRKLSVSFVLHDGLRETGFCDVQSGAAKNKIPSFSLFLYSFLPQFLSFSLLALYPSLSFSTCLLSRSSFLSPFFLSTFFRLPLFLDFYSVPVPLRTFRRGGAKTPRARWIDRFRRSPSRH